MTISFHLDEFKIFFLILIRISIVLFSLPFFNNINIPNMTKAAMALAFTIFLFPTITLEKAPNSFVLLIISELIIGIVLSLAINFIFCAAQLAGQLIGYQMGLLIPGAIDPQFGIQSSLLANFAYLLAFTMFLVLNGHYLLIKAIILSFEWVRPGSLFITPALCKKIIFLSGEMFKLAIKIAAPVSIALLFTEFSLGIIAKTVPQMEVLVAGFPLKIAVGFILLGLSLNMFLHIMKGNFNTLGFNLIQIIKLMPR